MTELVSQDAASLEQILEACRNTPDPGMFERLFFPEREPRLNRYLKQLREEDYASCLKKLGDKVLEGVPEKVKKELAYGRNIISVPENAIINPEGFREDSQVFYPGREDLGRLIFITGLTTSGTPWIPTARRLYDYSGIRTEVMTLAGHDGDWFHFRNCNNKDMLQQVLDTVKSNDIVFSFSTAGNIITQAENIKPGFCRGHVGVGWAYILRNAEHESIIDSVRAKTKGIAPLRKFYHTDYPRNACEDEVKCPQFVRMPFSVAVELRKSQLEAIKALESGLKGIGRNMGPLLYLQGENDAPICPKVRDFIAGDAVSSPLKLVPDLIPNGSHDVQNGQTHERVFEYILDYLPLLYRMTGVALSDIPLFSPHLQAMKNLEVEKGNIYRLKAAA